ncbi:MAG TPA: glycosyltransferase [Miltoncostaeaceae bacterium]|nr:glycosyltransferase [Miltoncostaeaceae bacterium]
MSEDAPGRGARILVLSAEVGEGHVAAARALAAGMSAPPFSADVAVVDGLAALGGPLRAMIRDGYRLQLRVAPWSYGALFALATHPPGLWAARGGLSLLAGRRLGSLVRSHRPDVVVSTFPALTSVLGRLRRRGRLSATLVATVTDLHAHALWAHRGVDLHLVMHEACLAQVERVAGPGSARVVQPLVAPGFLAPTERGAARRALGLPGDGTLILISGGGWGVGDLTGGVEGALRLSAARIVCICGRNEPVERHLAELYAGDERVVVLGFTERMSELLAAADAVVHTTGGMTCLEALACGCPMVAFGAPPGHLKANARALGRAGLGAVARTAAELPAALAGILPRAGRPVADGLPSAASAIAAAPKRVIPIPHWRIVSARACLAALMLLLVTSWSLSSDDAFPLVAAALEVAPITSVRSTLPDVGLVVAGPPGLDRSVLRRVAAARGRADIAISAPGSPALDRMVRRSGGELLPALGAGALTGWWRTAGRLGRLARGLDARAPRLYLVPRSGFSLGEYLLARRRGWRPVGGALDFAAGEPAPPAAPRPGEVIVLWLSSDRAASLALVDRALDSLADAGLTPVTVGSLVDAAGARG